MFDADVASATSAAGNTGNGETSTEPKPRALHKTQSIFLRNLAPTITHQEVEAVIATVKSVHSVVWIK